MLRVCVCLALLVGACASGGESNDADGGSMPRIDAGPGRDGGQVGGPGRAGAETVSGSGRLRGGSFTLDVQVGHPVGQQAATAGSRRLEGAAVVKP